MLCRHVRGRAHGSAALRSLPVPDGGHGHRPGVDLDVPESGTMGKSDSAVGFGTLSKNDNVVGFGAINKSESDFRFGELQEIQNRF